MRMKTILAELFVKGFVYLGFNAYTIYTLQPLRLTRHPACTSAAEGVTLASIALSELTRLSIDTRPHRPWRTWILAALNVSCAII